MRRLTIVGAVVALLTLAACGSDDTSAGVASLEGNSSSTDATDSDGTDEGASSEDVEAELQKWVECMRENGVEMSDPTTDEDGNLTLRPQGGGGAGPSTDAQPGGGQPPAMDRGAMDTAREECGDPPEGAMGGFDRGNSQEFQDSALEYAQCMRDNGVDMPDPTFEEPSTANGGRPEGGPGFFGNGGIDPEDPAVAKAIEACRDLRPGPGGGTAGGGADSQSEADA